MKTITTTIRWNKEELDRVKEEAKELGLPVALFVKSIVLKEVRKEKRRYNPEFVKAIREAEAQVERGEYEEFNSVEEFMEDMDKIINEHEKNQKDKNSNNKDFQ